MSFQNIYLMKGGMPDVFWIFPKIHSTFTNLINEIKDTYFGNNKAMPKFYSITLQVNMR